MENVESPKISHASKDLLLLPSYLTLIQNKLVIDPAFVVEGAGRDRYDIVMDFGGSRASLRGLVPKEQRLTKNTDNLTVLSFRNPRIKRAMNAITSLANDQNRSSNNPNNRQEYRDCLEYVYGAMAEDVIRRGSRNALFFAPKNGGIFVQEVFENAGIDSSNFFDYRMSRIQKVDGGLMVGTMLGVNNPDISDFRKFVFADDCMASDISAFGTMELIKEAITEKGKSLSEVEVLITVSAATQRGLESILSKDSREYFGFKSIKAVVGTLVYQMDDHFYLQHPDGRFVVGDMGNWTKSITSQN